MLQNDRPGDRDPYEDRDSPVESTYFQIKLTKRLPGRLHDKCPAKTLITASVASSNNAQTSAQEEQRVSRSWWRTLQRMSESYSLFVCVKPFVGIFTATCVAVPFSRQRSILFRHGLSACIIRARYEVLHCCTGNHNRLSTIVRTMRDSTYLCCSCASFSFGSISSPGSLHC